LSLALQISREPDFERSHAIPRRNTPIGLIPEGLFLFASVKRATH
jgi:hypothetical protein